MQHWLAQQAGLGYLALDASKKFELWGLGSAGCLDFGWAQIGITDW